MIFYVLNIFLIIFTLVCTEFIFDCSILSKHQFLTSLLFIPIIPWENVLMKYNKLKLKDKTLKMKSYFIHKIMLLLSFSLICFLMYNKPNVIKFVVDEESHIRRPTGNDIFIYYVLRKNKKKHKKIKEFDTGKFDQELISKCKDKEVYFDFTDYNSFEVANKLDKTHFSKLINSKCFIFDVSCVKIQKLKYLIQFEDDEAEPTDKKPNGPNLPGGSVPQDRKNDIPSPPPLPPGGPIPFDRKNNNIPLPPPLPPGQQSKPNPLPNQQNKQKMEEKVSLQDNLIDELKKRIKIREKKHLDEQLNDKKTSNPKSLHDVVKERRNAISMSSESEIEDLEELFEPVKANNTVKQKFLIEQTIKPSDSDYKPEVRANGPRILSSKAFLDELSGKVGNTEKESQECADNVFNSEIDKSEDKLEEDLENNPETNIINNSTDVTNEIQDDVKIEYPDSLADSNYDTMSDKSTDLNSPKIFNENLDSKKSKLELIEENIAYHKRIREMQRPDNEMNELNLLRKGLKTNFNFEEEKKYDNDCSENEWSV